MNKIIISNMYRAKNKQSFFAIHQIINKIHSNKPTCKIEFHILWDNDNSDVLWTDRINKLESENVKIYNYNKMFFDNYVKNYYFISTKFINNFKNFKAIYFILMAHYLRRTKLYDYYLIYDDDIIINYNFSDVVQYMLQDIPFFISEPMNMNCDKVLFNKLYNIYGNCLLDIYKLRNPNLLGFNAGFQYIDLSLYDDFLSIDNFKLLLELFDYSGVYDVNGNEIWGEKRFLIDTQQQSFFSIMNVIKSRNSFIILDPNEYFVVPNFGTHPLFGEINTSDENDGWTIALKSKIIHFIGHTQQNEKPIVFLNKMNEYLENISLT